MAKDVNVVVMSGRLVKDAEPVAFTNGGVLNFTIATNRSVKKGDSWEEAASYIDVKYFTKGFEKLATYLKKGTQVIVDGMIIQESWEKDGQKHSRLVVQAADVKWYGSSNNSQPQQASGNNSYNAGDNPFGNGGYPEDGFPSF